MADPYIGEIRAVAFNYAPDGWLLCQGQVLNINTYQALYALLGNTYGGQASQGTFGLPDLQGRSIIGAGVGANLPPITWGEKTGQGQLTLAINQMPLHTHAAMVNDPGHTHSAALPSHTHSFSIPCDNSGVAPTLASPAGNFLSSTVGIDTNINVAITDAGTANSNTGQGGSFPAVSGTPLYSKSGNGSMGSGTTGTPTATGASATGSSTTGVAVTLQGTGGVTPISTQSPALGVYYMIATMGIYPARP